MSLSDEAREYLVDLFGDAVDVSTFEQILEMDDEDEGSHEFSKGIVFDFLQQAESTFETMDVLLEEKNLEELSNRGHFLKGSSATLGFTHMKDGCEKIQHYGHQKDATGLNDEPDEDLCLKRISDTLKEVKEAYVRVEQLMQEYYSHLEGENS